MAAGSSGRVICPRAGQVSMERLFPQCLEIDRAVTPRNSAPAVFAILACALLAVLDGLYGEAFSLRLLVLPPLVFAAWVTGTRTGLLLAAGLALVWLFASAVADSPDRFVPARLWEAATRLGVFATIAGAAARLGDARRRERRLMRTDPLTLLDNGPAFRRSVEAEANRARRNGRPLAIAFLDCDRFKQVNDTLGHPVGDEVLTTVAATLRSNVRNYDIVARPGGDEFALLLPDTPPDGARTVVERVHAALRTTMASRGWNVTFSIGVATFPEPPADALEMIRTADALMYEAKRAGGDGVRYTDSIVASDDE
jgi:diguanylate cyclase (GGDEF)-like protein